jgi:hypothetical protein
MPTYDFIDTDTGEEFEMMMKWSEREDYLKNNPNIQPLLSAPNIVSGTTASSTNKVPDGFKEVLSKVSEKYPMSPLAEKHNTNKSIKDVKTREVVKKHVDRVTKRLQGQK